MSVLPFASHIGIWPVPTLFEIWGRLADEFSTRLRNVGDNMVRDQSGTSEHTAG